MKDIVKENYPTVKHMKNHNFEEFQTWKLSDSYNECFQFVIIVNYGSYIITTTMKKSQYFTYNLITFLLIDKILPKSLMCLMMTFSM